jgi:hypothetical protein
MSRTDQAQYHGGNLADELAALASLILGVRMKAGGITREFVPSGDAKGRPVAWDLRLEPLLRVAPYGRLIPAAGGERSLNILRVLAPLPNVEPADAIAFVRAARLYQEALWVAESDPSLGWLLLVSGIESAANQWRRGKDPAIERLRTDKPEFVSYLESCCVSELVKRVADEFADTLGSTKKFVDFLLMYLPPPPPRRPAWAMLSWDSAELRKDFRLIYKYRSKALHEGIPFPAPMCEPGFAIPNSDVPAEIPAGLAAASHGGVWIAEDTPMLLHIFEYVSRNAILSWWKSLTANATA